MSKISRNAPCPCGSGRKYKQCCLKRETEKARVRADFREAARIAAAWLNAHHREAMDAWAEQVWLAEADDAMREGIATADPQLRAIHDLNLIEMLIAEGELPPSGDAGEEAAPVRALDLVLAEAPLNAPQRAFLSLLGEAPLRLWEVTATQPGASFTLAPWPEGGEAHVIEDKWSSRAFDVGDVLALRVLDTPIGVETSGAICHFPPETLDELRNRLDSASEKPASLRIAHYWLELLAAHV
ncbi:MAG: SEC-C domain-containing protein [Mariprofundaceae bacterium]